MDLFRSTNVACVDLVKGPAPIRTGVGFLDHMVDQLNSHAQVGVGLTVHYGTTTPTTTTTTTNTQEEKKEDEIDTNRNRLAKVEDATTQSALMAHVGRTLGEAFAIHLTLNSLTTGTTSRFCCPLDEALVECTLTTATGNNSPSLVQYELAPYGKFPRATGRSHIGQMETLPLSEFWSSLGQASGLSISMKKIRGDNAHHIVESSFKAFSRALRNLLDGTCTTTINTSPIYAWSSENGQASVALQREGKVQRSTKETSIVAHLQLNGGTTTTTSSSIINTGIATLDDFLSTLSRAAEWSLECTCQGDLWVDEHHTAEDVSIALGQVLCQAMGNKAGLNRMWCARVDNVEVTVDLSNRPCLTHNLHLEEDEYIGDLTVEMFEHVLDSLVVNGRMTVHIVQDDLEQSPNKTLKETVQATAQAFGQALKYCLMVDCRRAGQTASSKGTLSV